MRRIAEQKAVAVEITTTRGLSTGTIGALGELMAASELMRLGFEVFRALSPACSSDLLLHKNGEAYRVEVRTAHYLTNGKMTCPVQNARAENVAFVTHSDGRVHLPEKLTPIQKDFVLFKRPSP